MPPRIAISLGASFLGYATHAGFLARLHELGVRPVAVGGSSAGAVAAGLYAAGLAPELIRETVCCHRFRSSFIRRTPWWTHYIRNTFFESNFSAFKPDGAVDHLEKVMGKLRIEDLPGPAFLAAVSDLAAGSTHFLTQGSLAHAMVASCCVPTLFAPLRHADMHCYDGGVAHETPVDPWLEDPGVDLIVVHRVGHTPARAPRMIPFNLIHLTSQAHACAGAQLLDYRRRLAVLHGKKMLVTTTTHDRPPLVSRGGMPPFYEMGRRQAEVFFESELKALLEDGTS